MLSLRAFAIPSAAAVPVSMSHESGSLKSILFALGANAAIAVAKLTAAVFTGSHSMLAEAIHSSADCGNQGLLLWGLKRAKRPPSPDHPLGFGKAIYFWSFIVALILFSMGGVFSIYEGIHKLDQDAPLTLPWLAVGILVFSILMELVSLRACLHEVNRERGSQGLWAWFRQTRQSALMVVLGEDIAALAGLAIALAAILLTMVTGNPVFDALGSIAIGVLLVGVAIGVGAEIKNLLIGESVEPRMRQAMQRFLEDRSEVDQVFNMLTLQMGNDVMVAVKARMREQKSARDLIDDINRCERAFKQTFPEVRWLFFEPDVSD
jgi:cation diffusion facilitator family transporter